MKFDINKASGTSTTGGQNFGIQGMDVDEETEAGIPSRFNYTSQLSKLKKNDDHKKKAIEGLAQTEDPSKMNSRR